MEETSAKPATPDLRKRACLEGPCTGVPAQTPPPVESDLRKRICKDGPCAPCPSGQSAGKDGGCVTTTAAISHGCQANESWNGTACAAVSRCPADQTWDGARCTSSAECASIHARAEMLASEIRAAHSERDRVCRNDPNSAECRDSESLYNGAVDRYRILMNEAPSRCRSSLLDPLSF